MGAYAYCDKCESPLRHPNLADLIFGFIPCPHCGEMAAYTIGYETRREELEELEESLRNHRHDESEIISDENNG